MESKPNVANTEDTGYVWEVGATVTTAGPNFEPTETPQSVGASMIVETVEEARALAASFPKSTKVRGGSLSTRTRDGEPVVVGYVKFNANLVANGVNGGVNETGMKRYRSFRKHVAALGHPIEWGTRYSNGIDEQTFERITAPAQEVAPELAECDCDDPTTMPELREECPVHATARELELVDRGIINDPSLGAASSFLGGIFTGETADQSEARVQRERTAGWWR